MAICNYYQRGICAYGTNCKFEHPGVETAFNRNPRQQQNTGAFRGHNQQRNKDAPPFSSDSIKTDLTDDRPQWPLSVYGPAKGEPNLLEGVDISPEELRIKYYDARSANDVSRYPETSLAAAMDGKIQNVLNNLNEAFAHARRNSTSGGGSAASTSAFTATASSSTPSAFGQPSTVAPTFGQRQSSPTLGAQASKNNAFGTTSSAAPAFSSTPDSGRTGAFGGAPAAPSFGTSAFGSSQNNAFGSLSGVAPAFGSGNNSLQPDQPFAFGGSTTSAVPSFGQPSFGASSFGSTTSPAPPGANNTTSSFGGGSSQGFAAFGKSNPPAFGSTSAFSSNAESTPATVPSSSSTPSAFAAFGQNNSISQPQPTFGSNTAASATTSAFGPSSNTNQTGFSAFGATPSSAPTSSFGNQPSTGGFGFTRSPPQDEYSSFAPQISDVSEKDKQRFEAEKFSWEDGWPDIEPPVAVR